MNRIIRKLRNKCGVSMMMALFLLLVTVFVSSIILTSSLSGMMVKHSDRYNEQAYLTVSSAVNMFKDYLASTSYTIIETDLYDTEDNLIDSDTNNTLSADREFKPLIENALAYVTEHGRDYQKEFTISVPNMDAVNVKFSMDANNYSMYAAFSLDEGGEYDCEMYLTVESKFKNTKTNSFDEEEEVYKVTQKTVVTWKTYYIEKGGNNEEDEE